MRCIAKEYYGYRISVLDLRNPTRSDGGNILMLVSRYMDAYLQNPENLALKAKAEKYAKITAKTIICSDGSEVPAATDRMPFSTMTPRDCWPA